MAASIAKSAAQHLGNLMIQEAKYLYKVEDKMESLQAELKWMECFLRDADTQQHKEEIICEWVSQVRDHAYEAEDIIQNYLHHVTLHRQSGIMNTLKWFSCVLCTCDVLILHRLGSDIDDLTSKISELTSRLQRYGIQIMKPSKSLEYNSLSREERRTYAHVEEDVVGFKKDIQQLMVNISTKNVNVVVISGTGGLGKTTLARKLFLDKEIQRQYVCVWVYISQEFQARRIFQEILSGILEKNKDENNYKEDISFGELPRRIDKLMKNKKCFIVLDDIWNIDAWRKLEPAFQSIKHSSSKILLTTRTQGLLKDAGWELLKRKTITRHESTDKEDFEKLGREMLMHCDGLPLAIVALGGILSTKKTFGEWKEVQQNITSYLMSEGHGSVRIVEVLELSYQDLPFYLKPCFLYLGIFPEDYEIKALKLYHMWGAEGLLAGEGKAGKQGQTSYDVGERYLNELVQRSMVQVEKYWSNGKIKACKVHDVMRDMCLKKCEEINFLSIVEWTKGHVDLALASCRSTKQKKLRRCVVQWKGDNAEENQTQVPTSKLGERKRSDTCVRSLSVFPPAWGIMADKRSEDIWKPFPLLRLLDLEGAPIRGVLKGVGNLIHLRYLSLKGTDTSKLPPCFFNLKYVETLDLRCEFIRFPSVKLQMMERLRHLYLPRRFKVNGGKKLRLPLGVQMETLKNFNPSICEIDDLLTMTNLRSFTVSRKYEFKDTSKLKGVLEMSAMKTQGQLNNTKMRLDIDAYILKEEPTILTSTPSFHRFRLAVNIREGTSIEDVRSGILGVNGLEELFLCEVFYEIQMEEANVLALEKLPLLKSLTLSTITLNKLVFSTDIFFHLNDITLVDLPVFEDLEVMDGTLPNLQQLTIARCVKLKKLPCGLPPSVKIKCFSPCIRGIESYNTCSRFDPDKAEDCFRGIYT